MSLPVNPYVRALIVNLVLVGVAALRILQQMGTKWTSRHTAAAYALGTVWVISTAVIGTLSRKAAERWSWLKVMMTSIACGLVTMVLILLFQKLAQRS